MSFPHYPLAFTAFPIIALLAHNALEVDPIVAARPLTMSILLTLAIMCVLRLLLGSWKKSAVLTALAVFMFFSYGHAYSIVKNLAVGGLVVGRHRYLFPSMVLLYLIATSYVFQTDRPLDKLTMWLNLVGIVMLLLPMIQLGRFLLNKRSSLQRAEVYAASGMRLSPPIEGELPDIYYIVLDGYTRADALERDFGFNNQPFLDSLRELGFYIADCSRSNYTFTSGSISAALGMDYLASSELLGIDSELETEDVWVSIRHSRVRSLLEELGYITIAFDTGYEWSRINDAEIYLSLERGPANLQRLDPFESLLMNTSAALVVSDLQAQRFKVRTEAIKDSISDEGFPLAGYVEGQLFILDQLAEIASLREPTFAFVHILTTHTPYVFAPDGEIWRDVGYYYGPKKEPIDESHLKSGYLAAIQFTNMRMLEILRAILASSDTPPIIIMHGDHGVREENRLPILNAYYFPRETHDRLYPSISPVNSFRILFDGHYGTSFGIVEDLSFWENQPFPVPEVSAACKLSQGAGSN